MSITQLILMPFQHIDDHTVYCVRVKCNNVRFHEIKQSFHDYVQFSQSLQQYLPKNNNVPKLKKDNIIKLLKSQTQKHENRQNKLDSFIKSLLTQVPLDIVNSDLFMNFFSDYSMASQQQQHIISKSSFKHVLSLRRPTLTRKNSSSEYFLSRSATVNVSCLTSPLYQSQQSQKSLQQYQQKLSTISCTSSMHSSVSSSDNEINDDEEEDGEEDGEDKLDMIKLKIIYNTENIIVIRVPRSISWEGLDTQVRQKFALLNIDLEENMNLQVTTCRNSTSSNFSNVMVDAPVTTSVISAQEDLSLAMQTTWTCLEKVTLRITL